MAFLFRWLVTDGQQYGTDLQYAPLPAAVRTLALEDLKHVTSEGSPVLT